MSEDHADGDAARHPRTSASRYIIRSRLLRGAFLSLVISGIGLSLTAPQITLFLVQELHLSTAQAGLYFLTNLSAPIAGYIVGSASDRSGSRLLVFRLCALGGFIGWALMALSTQGWMPFVINLLLLSVAGAGAAQLQAAVRDELNRTPTPADNEVVAVMRMSMAIGWIIGPVIGALLGALLGLRPLLLVTGLLVLLSMAPLIGVRTGDGVREIAPHPRPASPVRAPRSRTLLPLLVFTGVYVLVMCGETVKLAYLPLYLDEELRVDAGVRGAVIGLQPLVELLLMPVAARLATRFGVAPVLTVGGVMAVAAHVSYASASFIAPQLPMLISGQLLMAGVIATFGVLGITVAQRLVPARVGMASSVFYSSYAINAAVGGFTGSIGATWLGLPELFWIPAVIAAVGTVALVVLNTQVRLDGR